MLVIDDLTVRIAGLGLIDGASVQVPDGARVGLVGRNGAGKSTLFRVLAGDMAPDHGAVILPARARIGRLPQEAPDGPEPLIDTVLAADQERSRLLAEAGEDAGGPGRRGPGTDLVEPRLDLGDAQRRRAIELGQQRGAFGVGGERGFERVALAARRFLRQKAEAMAARQLDRAGIGLRRAANEGQEGRFAGAVAADQPDLAAGRDLRAGFIQQRSSANAVGQAGNRQHAVILPWRGEAAR